MAVAAYRIVAALFLAGVSAPPLVYADCRAPPNVDGMQEAEVLYLPTPQKVVEAMLRLAGVTRNDVVYDLGSGDGRIPISAAHAYGARAVGIELDGRMIARARCNARDAGMERLVEFRQEDLFRTDLRDATVVTLFLFPQMVQQLGPKLRAELRPGTRIVSHRFGIGNWPADRTIEVDGHAVLLWTVP
jgi:SAM-dependent methyltransferase